MENTKQPKQAKANAKKPAGKTILIAVPQNMNQIILGVVIVVVVLAVLLAAIPQLTQPSGAAPVTSDTEAADVLTDVGQDLAGAGGTLDEIIGSIK